jgi:hypothetical protein
VNGIGAQHASIHGARRRIAARALQARPRAGLIERRGDAMCSVPGSLLSVLALAALVLSGAGAARASPDAGRARVVLVENTDSTQCGMTTPSYGTIGVGSIVTLGRHAPWTGPTGDPTTPFVTGDDNWAPAMDGFVGRRAVVAELDGLDGAGCAGVRVDVDQGEWFWRVRDLAHGGVLRN